MNAPEHEQGAGGIAAELRVLTAPPSCLGPAELREALRVARRAGRALARREDLARAGLLVFRRIVLDMADAAQVLGPAARAYWRSPVAAVDGRVVAFEAGFALARAKAR